VSRRSRHDSSRQLGLFDSPEPARPSGQSLEPDPELVALAARLPKRLRFGTTSWTFEGWTTVYRKRYASKRDFVQSSLGEYASYPLFRTVEIDRSYYGPLSSRDLRTYAEQLPEDFDCAMKVWQEITAMVFPRHPRYGERAGMRNANFLDPVAFADAVIEPIEREFSTFIGPLIIEIPPPPSGSVDLQHFERQVARFLARAPGGYRYAFEVRDRRLLTPRYLSILHDYGASHVFNYWSRMPSLADQLDIEGTMQGAFVVARLMLPPGERYDDLKERFSPFDKIAQPQPEMRSDVVRLVREAGERELDTYILVNNKAEGSSPLTVGALAGLIASDWETAQ
jgi:uncharacterized protein YecE (DUF72 family)